ncbi:MBL fold metallo-hydrolase [Ruminococcus sp.]|uniref:MBL fold metallo-hydrolase n=1 Tax=Ruminococcus sp. TaxID=41978 RepID=UPI0025DFABA0|nr:MBL fold metallo-hydrolase [Ruminococcus sp.]MBQ8967805.1 MBL fold metallo-hydrolase [Ruminococcus sp.]
MIHLRYGNTNTFYIKGSRGSILVDTDFAGTLQGFYRAIKMNNIKVVDIDYVLATHYHPDHMGLISELMAQGVKLLLIDIQQGSVHYSDNIFARDPRLDYTPIDETRAEVISCADSRSFLAELGINGEIVSTPSHSEDSISLVLDEGICLAGDLEPMEYLGAYDENIPLKQDWELILSKHPKRICYAHANEKKFEEE